MPGGPEYFEIQFFKSGIIFTSGNFMRFRINVNIRFTAYFK
jgi:hypothetical protein